LKNIELRDYLAAHAPTMPEAFERKRDQFRNISETGLEQMIRWRYHYADLMLKERNATH